MKTQHLITSALAGVVLVLCLGAGEQQRKHECVILRGSEAGYGVPATKTNAYYYQYAGVLIYCSDSSAGAPQYPQMAIGQGTVLKPMAEAIAELMDEGYHIVSQSANLLDYTLVK